MKYFKKNNADTCVDIVKNVSVYMCILIVCGIGLLNEMF